MSATIFLAGATGAIGQRLVPLLLRAGYNVFGTTRSEEKARSLESAGVHPVVVDVFDTEKLARAVRLAKPDTVIHQLTDLPRTIDPTNAADFAAHNARMRREGTASLMQAAIAAGVERVIAQSIAWTYAPGHEPYDEEMPLDLLAPEPRLTSVCGAVALESAVLAHPQSVTGIVLRYGHLYGPGTGVDKPGTSPTVHVDAAACAAVLAIKAGAHGIYNIADAGFAVTSKKAIQTLGWSADFRL